MIKNSILIAAALVGLLLCLAGIYLITFSPADDQSKKGILEIVGGLFTLMCAYFGSLPPEKEEVDENGHR